MTFFRAFLAAALIGYALPVWAQNVPGAGIGGKLPQDLDTWQQLVPSTTQTQAGAIAGANSVCFDTICYVPAANSGDVVALRQCTIAPMRVTIINNSGNSITVFGSGTDTINGIATATGIALPAVTSTLKVGTAEFTCAVGGTAAKWFTH
jgi:hypothetical protein